MEEKRKLSLTDECQIINIEGMVYLENHQWMLKLLSESLIRKEIV